QGQGQQQGGQQPGQQPGQGQGSQPNGGRLGTSPQGQPGNPSAITAGRPLTPEEARQFGREFRDRREAAEGLRRELTQQGESTKELDQLIARMRALEGTKPYEDPRALAQLQEQVVEGLKSFEFGLRRKLDVQPDRPLLNSNDQVPAGYKQLVEEYYKSLAKKP
ncbi:MAG: hypothetical protein ABJD07_14460, partial [Gemmatimonadaceae bacterium]